MVGRTGFEPVKAEPTDLQSVAFDRFATYPFLDAPLWNELECILHVKNVKRLQLIQRYPRRNRYIKRTFLSAHRNF